MIISRPLSGFLPLSGGTLTGPLYLNAVQVEGVRTTAEAENAGPVTVTGAVTILASVALGTVLTGDRIRVTGEALLVKGAVDGLTLLTVKNGGGTATVKLAYGTRNLEEWELVVALNTFEHHITSTLEVTAGGTLTLDVQAQSFASDSTCAAARSRIRAEVVGYG